MLAHLEQSNDLDFMTDCYNFYWHNEQYDAPAGSYNKLILIGGRMVEVDPSDYDMWATTAWLQWSKWVVWRKDPSRMPDGEDQMHQAYLTLLRGQSHNLTNARYHWEAANTLWLAARGQAREYYPFVLDSYQRVDEFAQDTELKVRARFRLGQVYYRELQNKIDGVYWYKKVLELDPKHQGALDALAEIGANKVPSRSEAAIK
jgi:hypothetical protein